MSESPTLGLETYDENPFSCSVAQGESAELLVCFEFASRGFPARMSPFQGAAYDLVVDSGHGGFIRVQVKSTVNPKARPHRYSRKKNGFYEYNYLGYEFRAGEKGFIRYRGLVDVFAFVALDTATVLYLPADEVVHEKNRVQKKRFQASSFADRARGSLDRFLFNWMFS